MDGGADGKSSPKMNVMTSSNARPRGRRAVDTVYSFPNKKCPSNKKAVFELVKKMVEWKLTDGWDEENNWLLEGRTVLIYKGGDRKDPANFRPLHASRRSQRW